MPTVYDPEILVDIYDRGLIYQLSVDDASGKVGIRMTLTAPGCPVAQAFPGVVEGAVMEASGGTKSTWSWYGTRPDRENE